VTESTPWRAAALLAAIVAGTGAFHFPAARAKPELAKIEITGGGLTEPLRITDTALVRRFSLWTGPGTSEGWRAHERAFIDWPRGEVVERPSGLPRYEVSFHWKVNGEPIYAVSYEFDERAEGGFMYLPASHTGTIVHGIEGRWFHSSPAWESLIRPLLTKGPNPPRRLAAAQTGCDTTRGVAGDTVYDSETVDEPVQAVRLPIEDMPFRMREVLTGRSVFRFVVEPSGRIDRCSIELIEESAPAWTDAVLKELRQARYRPARRDSKEVRQRVYQIFTYNQDGRFPEGR